MRVQRIDIPWQPQDTGHLFCPLGATAVKQPPVGRCRVSLLGESEWCRPGALADSPRFLWLPPFGWGRGGGGRELRVLSMCLRGLKVCATLEQKKKKKLKN